MIFGTYWISLAVMFDGSDSHGGHSALVEGLELLILLFGDRFPCIYVDKDVILIFIRCIPSLFIFGVEFVMVK